jgi:hypothetical protein
MGSSLPLAGFRMSSLGIGHLSVSFLSLLAHSPLHL